MAKFFVIFAVTVLQLYCAVLSADVSIPPLSSREGTVNSSDVISPAIAVNVNVPAANANASEDDAITTENSNDETPTPKPTRGLLPARLHSSTHPPLIHGGDTETTQVPLLNITSSSSTSTSTETTTTTSTMASTTQRTTKETAKPTMHPATVRGNEPSSAKSEMTTSQPSHGHSGSEGLYSSLALVFVCIFAIIPSVVY